MTVEDATKLVLNKANKRWSKITGVDYILDKNSPIIEKETLWYIPFIEKDIAKREPWVGAFQGYIIEKNSGEMFQPGSAYSLDEWIWGFELGFRNNKIDFTISSIKDFTKTSRLITELGIQYVIPEYESGTTWMIPKHYTKEEITTRLKQLPCTFENQNLTIRLDIIKEILKSSALEFSIKNTTCSYKKEIHGELIDKNGLIKK
ncbi:hypothetical protein [Aureispira anguillae]|uniref:Uncharacterized protein n=1 Tax=Aureispira anguillae TaxID=2864201 RepID=A0A916DSS7_9BACT|nr:hypothetical protein [Aureispira anguillae]BDS12729.1 hypothetical protein AsAng_0034540 [Aureispira anguillae]